MSVSPRASTRTDVSAVYANLGYVLKRQGRIDDWLKNFEAFERNGKDRLLVALYGLLERIRPNPMVSLNRAIADAMADGPQAGLALLEPLEQSLGRHHRLHAARAHLLEMAGETADVVIGCAGGGSTWPGSRDDNRASTGMASNSASAPPT